MNRMRMIIVACVASGTLDACADSAPQSTLAPPAQVEAVASSTYTIVDISGPTGDAQSAFAINASGDVTLWVDTPFGPGGAVRLANGTRVPLPISPPECFPVATALNKYREVAGYGGCPSTGSVRSFLWSIGGRVTDPFQTNRSEHGEAYALNDHGTIVGFRTFAGVCCHAYVWSRRSGGQDLGTLGGLQSGARGINNEDHVVGFSATLNSGNHAFLWSARGGMRDLGILGTAAEAAAVNSHDEVVGVWLPAPGVFRAFIWNSAGGLVDLGQLNGENTIPTAINDRGQIAGWTLEGHAWVMNRGGSMVQLPELGSISVAWGINACGAIVGSSGSRAAIWTDGGRCP